jgi:hypothetical protein
MRNSIQAGTATSRDILFHPIGKAQIIQLVDTFSNWMLVPTWIPTSFRTIFLLGFLLLVVVVLTIVLRSSGADDRKENILILWGWIPELIKIVILFILLYLLFLVISISFVDANTPLDERILSPVFVAGLIIIVYAFGRLLTAESTHRYVKYLIVTLLLVFSVVNVMNISDWIKVRQTAGMGFSNSRWKDSGAIAWLNELPSGETVYTNAPEVVYLYTPHLALRLPVEQFSVTGQDNLNYREDLHVVKSQLIQSDGYVLYFPLPGYTTQADETRLVEDLGLCLITKTANGNLYHLSEPGEPCQF